MAMPRSFGEVPIEDGASYQKGEKLRRRIIIALFILPVIVAIVYSLFQEGGIYWLFEVKSDFPDINLQNDVGVILAPLTALALAIERIIETVFDLIEQSLTTMAKLIGESKQAVKWFEEEYSQASKQVKQWIKTISEIKEQTSPGELPPLDKLKEAQKQLKLAEERLEKASERLKAITRDPHYISTKRAISIMLGLFLGFLVAIFSDQGIFAYLQQGVPRIVDIFVTGFVIGAGSGPMHSLVGILQGLKEAISNFGKTPDLDLIKVEIEKLKGLQDED